MLVQNFPFIYSGQKPQNIVIKTESLFLLFNAPQKNFWAGNLCNGLQKRQGRLLCLNLFVVRIAWHFGSGHAYPPRANCIKYIVLISWSRKLVCRHVYVSALVANVFVLVVGGSSSSRCLRKFDKLDRESNFTVSTFKTPFQPKIML